MDNSAGLGFKRVLVACRGIAAMRLLRACRELGLAVTVAYSEADRDSPWAMLADDAVCVGPVPEADSYGNFWRVLSAAEVARCDAAAPGDGPLAGNAEFAEAAASCGVTVIGPDAETARRLSDRLECRRLVGQADVPIVEASGALAEGDWGQTAAAELGFPLVCRAVSGKGPARLIRRERDLESGVQLCRAEARAATGDGRVYLEKLPEVNRRVRVPVLADKSGDCFALPECDVSISFRGLVPATESPSPAVGVELRQQLAEVAERAARALGIVSPAMLDFVLSGSGKYWFDGIETRLELDHPMLEELTGVDWAGAAIRAAGGIKAVDDCREVCSPRGWVLQHRLIAVNPDADFERTSGLLTEVRLPGGPGVRVDSAIAAGMEVLPVYEPTLAAITVRAPDRQRAITRMQACLSDAAVNGVKTTLGLLRRLAANARYRAGEPVGGDLDEDTQP